MQYTTKSSCVVWCGVDSSLISSRPHAIRYVTFTIIGQPSSKSSSSKVIIIIITCYSAVAADEGVGTLTL